MEKYLQGTLSGAEEDELAAWVNATKENQQQFKQKIRQLEGMQTPPVIAKWAQLAVEVHNRRRRRRIRAGWKIAAAVALVFGLSWWGVRHYSPWQPGLVVVQVPYGTIDSVVLPDQSTVILNAGSVLTYAQDFGNNNRDVELEGEGFFRVTKQNGAKFTVKTRKMTAVVYGTSFNFTCYSNTAEVAVTLCTGSLQVETPGEEEPFLIRPGEQVCYDQINGRIKKQKVDTEVYCKWLNGTLSFQSERLTTIAPKLERKYKVSVNLQSAGLEDCLFSGEFPADASLDYVLEVIKESAPTPLKIEKQGNIVYISADK